MSEYNIKVSKLEDDSYKLKINNYSRYEVEEVEALAIKYLQNQLQQKENIINELDNMFYETFRISQNGYYSISEWQLKEFTDKIKELKGSDKE